MTEHFTQGTLGCLAWCNFCGRPTQHSVSAGRKGHCLEHEPALLSKKQIRDRARREEQARNLTLFGEHDSPR